MMKTPDHDPLDTLLRDAAHDPRRGEWMREAARGLEARVLRRLAQPETWAEAVFSLTSWRPLAAAVAVVLLVGVWTGGSVADVFDDDWLAIEAAGDTGETPDNFDF
jgi:hypothetical protein